MHRSLLQGERPRSSRSSRSGVLGLTDPQARAPCAACYIKRSSPSASIKSSGCHHFRKPSGIGLGNSSPRYLESWVLTTKGLVRSRAGAENPEATQLGHICSKAGSLSPRSSEAAEIDPAKVCAAGPSKTTILWHPPEKTRVGVFGPEKDPGLLPEKDPGLLLLTCSSDFAVKITHSIAFRDLFSHSRAGPGHPTWVSCRPDWGGDSRRERPAHQSRPH